MTREEWLEAMMGELRFEFIRAKFALPKGIRLSVGWSSRGAKSARALKTVGQCWSREVSTDEHIEIFIMPHQDDLVEVGATLVHELCHAAVGVEHKHDRVFGRCAKAMGLVGKLTGTTAGPELTKLLVKLADKVGPYPHARMDVSCGVRSGDGDEKKQGTRLLKVLCPECGYTIRVTQKWLEVGFPTCPCGEVMVEPGEESPLKGVLVPLV